MAIITEDYTTGSGTVLKRRYSDKNKYIKNSAGDIFVEAIDPVGAAVNYTETDDDIPEEPLTAEEALKMIQEVM